MRKIGFCGFTKSAVVAMITVFSLMMLSLLYSCKKEVVAGQPIKEKVQYDDAAVNLAIDKINANAGGLAYFNRVTGEMGAARWNKSMTGNRGETLICLVPLARDSEREVSGFLALEADSVLRFKVFRADRPETGDLVLGAGHTSNLVNAFNYSLFGTQPKDGGSRIQESPKKVTQRLGGSGGNGKLSTIFTVTNCYEWTSCTGNGRGDCIGNIYVHRECMSSTIWTDDCDYTSADEGGGGGGFGDSGGAGSAGGDTCVTNFVEPPKNKIEDLLKYLSCFDQGKGGTLILYVDQPQPGSDNPFTLLGLMGHVFIGLEQTVNGATIRRTMGFAANERVTPLRTTAPSTLGDDSGRGYDVKLSIELNSTQFSNAILQALLHQPVYDLENYNCTDFALDVAQAAGTILPRTKIYWYTGSGRSPGTLGQDLRALPGVDTQKGKAPDNAVLCN